MDHTGLNRDDIGNVGSVRDVIEYIGPNEDVTRYIDLIQRIPKM